VIIEDRFLDVLRGHRTPQEMAVTDLWTGHWVVKGLDAATASQVAQEANESFRAAASRRIAQAPDELELEVLLEMRKGTLLEHNAWSWRFYERMGTSEWRALPSAVRTMLWRWRQDDSLALKSKVIFDGVRKPPIGCFQQLMLSPVSAAWLDAHYPNG
jgi:hypothetical protein